MENDIDVYRVTMFDRAYRDLDGIYDYIANTLMEPGPAKNTVRSFYRLKSGYEHLLEKESDTW